MSLIRSDELAKLVAKEKELEALCDPTIQDSDCKEQKLTDIIIKIIEEVAGGAVVIKAGEGISIEDNFVNVNAGPGLKIDLSNRVAVDYGSLPLATPSLTSETKEYNIGKTSLLRTLTVNNPAIEEGAVVDIITKYKYVLGTAFSAPTTVTGDYSSVIPPDNTFSADLLISDYSINTNVDNLLKTVNFVRPKSGLNVVNGKVIAPSGNETTSASFLSTIVYPFYIGSASTDNINQGDLNSFTKKLNIKSGNIVFNDVTSDPAQYLFFVFPLDVSLNNVIMDGAAPIFGAFINLGSAQFITATGKNKTMNIFRSTAKGAFSNNSLRFEFTQL